MAVLTNQKTSPNTHRLPELDDLCRFKMLQHLSKNQIQLLASHAPIHSAPAQTRLLKRGDNNSKSIFLLKGTLELIAVDGRCLRIDSTNPSAQDPIANLLPRRYDVICLTPVEYLCFDTHLLDGLQKDRTLDANNSLIENFPDSANNNLDILDCLTRDLEQDRFVLPSLPDVAVHLGHAINDHNSDLKKIARLVQIDPAITTKLIKAANSPIYYRNRKIQSCLDAITILGLDATHKLVVSFVMRDLFRPVNQMLEARMQEIWNHSIRVAALCYVLARLTRKFPPERVLLAGLLHKIGVIGILAHVGRSQIIDIDSNTLDKIIDDMQATVGEMILSKWQFPEHTITAARESEDWMRDRSELDDCDLVIVAQIHSFMGTPKIQKVPALDEIPAFHRLGFIELTPRKSMIILEKAGEQIADVESLFRA